MSETALYIYAILLPSGDIASTPSGSFFTSRETARQAKKLLSFENAQVVRVPVKSSSWERVR